VRAPRAATGGTDMEQQYVGFWARLVACLINTAIICVPLWILMQVLGIHIDLAASREELQAQLDRIQVVDLVLSAAFFIGLWLATKTDPGKMLFGAVIVDADTGEKPSALKYVLRYLGYIVSTIPLCLGFLWIAFDARKQGFHDKIANTVVVKKA
jgi:uncharacterized RDD family membrane protein YckC